MSRIYSIDQTIANQRVGIELRGAVYFLRDMPMAERLEQMWQMAREQEDREAELQAAGEADPDDGASFDQLREVFAKGVRAVLEGVPDYVALSITELEYQVLMDAVQKARDMEVVAERKKSVPPQS